MSLQLRSISGFSDETAGTALTALPTTISTARNEVYRFELDTTAGDINATALSITGALSGQTFEFVKTSTDANGITFTDPITSIVYAFDLQGEILSVRFDGTNYVIGA